MARRTKKSLDWYLFGGIVLSIWAVLNTWISVTRYGIETGFYWWFCNLALIGVAGGLLSKHRGWLTGFVSIALFTQIFWVIDNQYRLMTGENLFGLAEFMFQPGLPLDEFILSHYHYLTIPIALTALYFLPKGKSNALLLITIFNPLIFGVSYFVFPKVQNINCIHEPCFPGLQYLAGPTYSVLFWAGIFAMHLLIGFSVEKFYRTVQVTKEGKTFVLRGFVSVLVLALGIAIWDIQYKRELPSLGCATEPSSLGVEIECGYTLDYSPGIMLFNYKVANSDSSPRVCRTLMSIGENTLLMDSHLQINEKATKKSQVLVPYPHIDSIAHLRVECLPIEREAASK